MLYFLLTLLLLHITYDKCNTSNTLPLELTNLSNVDNAFASIQPLSDISSSLAYGPFHNCTQTMVLNQWHHRFMGPMTQHSLIGLTTQHRFIGLMSQHRFIGFTTQLRFIGLTTQHRYIGPRTQHSFIGLTTQHRYIGPMTQHSFIGLTTQHRYIGPMTQHNFFGLTTRPRYIGPMTQHSFIGLTTRHRYIGSMTQHSFIGLTTLHGYTAPITQIPDNMETLVYQSQYSFVTPQYALLHNFFHSEDEYMGLSRKGETPILDHSKMKLVFGTISSPDTSLFLRRISTLLLRRLKKRLSFCHNRNIENNIYIFLSSSHDLDLLIARILMRLQRYITRRNDFAYYWRSLLFHGLLKSQHMFFLVLIVLFRLTCIFLINLVIFFINRAIFLMNLLIFLYITIVRLLIYLYMIIQILFIHLRRLRVAISRNKIKIVLHICLLLMHFYKWAYFMTFCMPETSVFTVSDVEIKETFVGGGASTRSDFQMLEPYIISTNFHVEDPENYNYLYDGYGSINKTMQKIQTCGENHIICNIPLASIASILTTTQANEVAKKHNIHILIRKPLAEK